MAKEPMPPAAFLASVPLLADLPGEALETIRRRLAVRRLPAGTVLFRQGDPGRSMFIIGSGMVEITAEDAQGQKVRLAILGSGDCFGEISALDGGPRSATVIAIEATELLELSREDLWEYLERHPPLTRRLLQLVCHRLRAADVHLLGMEGARRSLEWLSLTDGLTGLANRRRFDEELPREVARAGRGNQPLALLMLDVDLLKRYNDAFGHAAGDSLLQRIATAIASATRASDLATRYGGDEFAVILPGTDAEAAARVAERIRHLVEVLAPETAAAAPSHSASISIGIAAIRPEGDTPEALLRRADDALYRAKAEGRNRVREHTAPA
jgi:diguanylate cyclase (GGDEF)-like protein